MSLFEIINIFVNCCMTGQAETGVRMSLCVCVCMCVCVCERERERERERVSK